VTPLTRFRVGSVSKSLTAAALGLLVEEGKLDLDAPVQRYVPAFPRKRWPVTTRQAAGHLAGIRHYLPGEFESRRHYATVAEHVDSLIPFRARFYARDTAGGRPDSAAGGIVNAPYVDNSYKWAGGGFLSTTEDLARFAQALLAGRLLKPATLRLLWTSQRTRDGEETGYGLGWTVRTDSAGRRRVGHTGGSMGGTANLIIYPEERLVVALLVNSDRTFIGAAPRIAEGFPRAAPARMGAGSR
jgi:CubicO group peptidase (beta-lactamase class C family)